MILRCRLFLCLAILLLAAACANGDPVPTAVSVPANTAAPTITPSQTPTATLTATPTATPTATATSTPTPTPTVTAMPLSAAGDLRTAVLQPPQLDGRSACGFVDILDFPIDPPDAASVSRGGGDFGVFRSRYDKFHAGEDWGGPSGQSNLGTAVYSIGHGLVTYAKPLGWGRDQGVVIIEHTFIDGTNLLSFYGHLDPESVILAPGSCVIRGDLVGKIGQPRSSPHLHFEVRTQSPYNTLTGYWPEDPTTVGWLWPSQTIWAQRVSTIPGVQWTRPFAATGTQFVGQQNDSTTLLLEAGQLIQLNQSDGSWQPRPLTDVNQIGSALMHAQTLFTIENNTHLAVFDADLTPQWQMIVPGSGPPQLLPLANGGVLVAYRSDWFGVSAAGELLWQLDVNERPFAHALTADALYLSGNAETVWRIAGDDPPVELAAIGGKLAVADNQLWIYATHGLYRLDITSADAAPELMYALPTGTLSRGDILVLADGSLLLAHADIADRRLLAFAPDGSLSWQRSYKNVVSGDVRLLEVGERPYLTSQLGGGTDAGLTLFEIDMNTQLLTRRFFGGSRTPVSADMWATAVDDRILLLNVGGGPLAAFEPPQ